MFDELKQVYDSLVDRESKMIFEKRLLYNLTGDIEYFFDLLYKSEERDRSFQYLSDFYHKKSLNGKKLIAFGAKGAHAWSLIHMCELKGMPIQLFCDNDQSKWGTKFFDIPVISPEELKNNWREGSIVLIATPVLNSENQIYMQLLDMGMKKENIYKMMSWKSGSEYFEEFFMPEKEDGKGVYVDAGTFDGGNIIEYSEWCNHCYNKIYAFEPNKGNLELCKKNLAENSIDRVEFFQYGLWSERKKLRFTEKYDASIIGNNGECEIEVISIDEVLNGDPVSFIKMDIEGSELEALKGAYKTIQRHKPQMAICIYHKPEDIINIPIYIKELLPDCKFYLRHKNHYFFDTILYVIP